MQIIYKTVDGDVAARLKRMFGADTNYLRVEPSQWLIPPQFVFLGTTIRDMEIHNDDVWMISYPRTGSHWAQEMAWCIGNNFNYENAKVPLLVRNPLLEASALEVTDKYVDIFPKLENSVENVKKTARPRYIKSHLPWELLPHQIFKIKPKIIYVTRNPKDTCVSFYHYCRLFHNLKGTFEEFSELFIEDNAPMGPFWKHVLPFWTHRNEENLLFLTYEDMKRDQLSAIRKTAAFLDKDISDQQAEELSKHLEFSAMAANPAINLECLLTPTKDPNMKFIRKGNVGDWKNYMDDNLSHKFDEWIEKNSKDTGLVFSSSI